jgi:hypothetical protein
MSNQELLDEVNKSRLWFRAKKTGFIWAKEITTQQMVQTIEGAAEAQPGDYLCRGSANEVWPQASKTLHSKYQSTEEVDDDGWRKFVVRETGSGVMAARVEHPFQVKTTWGDLSGTDGDYLVKNYNDKDVEYPDDVWIVSKEIFAATYTQVD